jgi:hypothetical protein
VQIFDSVVNSLQTARDVGSGDGGTVQNNRFAEGRGGSIAKKTGGHHSLAALSTFKAGGVNGRAALGGKKHDSTLKR